MKKIGIDIRLLGKGRTGDEAVFFNLTKELLALDHANQYVLFTDESRPEKLLELEQKLSCVGNTRVSFAALPAQNRFLWNMLVLPWRLWFYPVDIYHTQYIAPLFLPARTKLVTHIHDVSFRAHPEWIGILDRFFLSLLIPRSLKRSAMLVAPSVFTRDELMRFFQIEKERIVVIPNALSSEWLLSYSKEDERSIQKKLTLAGPYFISIGTMQPRKNIAFLIQAFKMFREKYPEVSLVLVGNPLGHHVDPAVQKAFHAKEPGLVFPGYLELGELQALVAGSRALIFPSLYEGFGIPLLEAYAMSVPVAASDIPSFREIAGEAAHFFDPASLAEAEKSLYTLYIESEIRASLVTRGKERLALFSWEESARKLLALYEQL